MKPQVSVILPAFNEARNIYVTCTEVMGVFESLPLDFELIIVDDGSSDGTHREAARLFARPGGERVKVVRYAKNQGKGHAIVRGVEQAEGRLLVLLDADLDLHPRQIRRFFEIMDSRGADVVIGSKMHPESVVDYPLRRRIYSLCYYGLVLLLFGLPVRDTQTGMKLFKGDVLRSVCKRILVKRFAFDIEILANAHRLGCTIAEAPIVLEFQKKHAGINYRDVYRILIDTLAIFYRMRLIRYYDRPIAARGEESAEMVSVLTRESYVTA